MTPEQIGRLFVEFAQADMATTRKYGGTGLGLAISKRLVAAMGGEIEVESTAESGSAFRFSVQLPVVAALSAEGAEVTSLDCRRVLVVDDYPVARDSMADLLLSMGCPVVDRSAGGEDALARMRAATAEGRPYDLLLLDWLMPDLPGGELIAAARARGIALPPKIIVVAATDAALLRQEVLQAGITDVVQKPLLPSVLRRICGAGTGEHPAMADSSRPRPGCLQGMTILLVEDNAMNQQVAEEILEGWGASVEVAANGRIALDLLTAQPPGHYAVVLMDIEMPVMDGRETTRRLRDDPRFRDLPIIAMTAHVAGRSMQNGLADGVNAYIAKPFEPDELLAMVQPYWRGPVGQHPLPEASAVGAVTEQAFVAALEAVPDIESAVLFRRFAGRLPFLARSLRGFVEDSRGWSERLGDTLARGELAVAQREAHTFKGLAGTFAMIRLQAALYDLESAIKGGSAEPFGEIAEVDVRLQPLLAGLERVPCHLVEPDVPGDGRPIDVVLSVLCDRLGEADGEAEEIWRQNKGRLAGVFSPRQMAAIDRAMDRWDFDEALAILAKARQERGDQR